MKIDRYSGGAAQVEAALCCPVIYDAETKGTRHASPCEGPGCC